MGWRDRLQDAAAGFVPLLLTIGTLAPLAAIRHLGAGVVILGAAVCLAVQPRGGRGSTVAPGSVAPGSVAPAGAALGSVALRVLATTVGVGVLAFLFSTSLWLGDAVFVVVLLGSRLVGAIGPRWAAAGRAILLPLVALFLAPPLHVAGGMRAALGWALVACLVASVWLVLAQLVLAQLVLARAARVRTTPPAPAPEESPSVRVRTRLAIASTISAAAGLLVGQALFPVHWPWTIITVMTVSLSAKSRGEVLLYSGQRLVGALAATIVASPVASVLAPHRLATVLSLLVVLAVGWYFRGTSRVAWTAAITAVLAFLAALAGSSGGTWGLLGVRLLAIGVGGICAIVPALILAPRTRDLVRKRAGSCLRWLRSCLDAPSVDALKSFETALDDLRQASMPLRFSVHRKAIERGWYPALVQTLPELRTFVATGDVALAQPIWRVLGAIVGEVRATRRAPAPTPEPQEAT